MFDFLTTIGSEARTEHLRAYKHYLLERDGEFDMIKRTLSRREPQMQRFENVAPEYSLDPALFAKQFAKFDPSVSTSQEMLLLLTLCKLNAAEAYGVDATFEIAARHARENPENDIDVRVLIEEHYHTRILMSSASEYGLTVAQVFQPDVALRGLIGGITSVPLQIARPLVLASELVGTLLFAQVFVRAGQVLAHRPALRDRIQERITEILIDEIGHVTFNQLLLGAWGMFSARRLFAMVAVGMRNQNGEWRGLGINTTTDVSWLKRLPGEVLQRAFLLRESALVSGAA